jgi:predicted nucleic acid-binding protein
MIVVADSSPLHYLILLDQTDLLHRLYENVLIPDAVAAELRAEASPRKVSQWLSGGFLGLQLALRRPELVRSIAAYEPVAFWSAR